jgi:hypothetical protein
MISRLCRFAVAITSASLVASVLISGNAAVSADDFSIECEGGFAPVYSGRVVDGDGVAVPYVNVQATFEVDHGYSRERITTAYSSDVDGNYLLCPLISYDSGSPALAPTPIVGSEAIFTVTSPDYFSISIQKFTISNDDSQCIESGGPCIFDLTIKQGNKLTAQGVNAADPSVDTSFDGQLYGASPVVDEEEGNYTDVYPLGGFQTTSSGTFDIYGLTEGELRFSLRPNQSDWLMSSAWQVLVNGEGTPTVTQLLGWGDGEAVRSDSTQGDPVLETGEVFVLPSPVATTKYMLTDGTLPLSSDHLSSGGSLVRFIEDPDNSNRFLEDPTCNTEGELSAEQGAYCYGFIDLNYRGEFLVSRTDGYYRVYAGFGYNPQGVETTFVIQIEDSQLVNAWRNSGFATSSDGQVNTWSAIGIVNNNEAGIVNGLTLHQHDLEIGMANFENENNEFWINGHLCLFEGECGDDMPYDEFSLYGSNVSQTGQVAFPDAGMLGASCDTQTDGTNPELQLSVNAGGWTPENYISTRFAIDCAGALGARTFVGYKLVGYGDSKVVGARINLLELELDSSQITGLVFKPNSDPVNANNVNFYPIDSQGIRDNSVENYWENLQFQTYSGTRAEHFGKFSVSARTSGSYALAFGVEDGSSDFAGAVGIIRFDVVVDESGNITSAKYGPSLSSVPALDGLANPIQVTLNAPNIQGSLLSQSGSPIRNQYFQVYKFDSENNSDWNDGYEHYSGAMNTSSNGSGGISLYLPTGQYRITLPASNGQPMTEIDIWVDSSDNACRLSNQTGNALCGDNAITNWTWRYAEPNFSGVVTANGNPVAAQVNVQVRSSSGWWQSTGDYIDANLGQFASRLANTGFYRIEFQPRSWGQNPLEGFVTSFSYIKVDANKNLCIVAANFNFDAPLSPCPSDSTRELTSSFPLDSANLAFRVMAPTTSGGQPSAAAYASVEVRETTENLMMGEYFWSNTNSNGRAYLNLPGTQGLTRFFDAVIRPSGNNGGLILANKLRKFCTIGDGDVYQVVAGVCQSSDPISSEFEVLLAEGNVSGRIKTSDIQNLPANSNAHAEVRSWDDTCPDCSGNSNTWGWLWTNNGLNNSANGTFGGELEPGTYLIKASTWRSSYAPGAAVIRVGTNGDESPWCLVAADADVLDIPEYNNAENRLEENIDAAVAANVSGVSDCDPVKNPASSLNVLLKAPNIIGLLSDPNSAPIRNAWGQIYKVTGTSDWSREYVSGISIQSGRFVGRVKLPAPEAEPIIYGIQFEQPQGQEGSRFEVALSCTSLGCVADVDGTEISSVNLSLSYPAPNFVGRVCSPESTPAVAGSDTQPGSEYSCDPVKYAHLNVQKWNGSNWEWLNNWANTNARGEFSLNVADDGDYRLTAYPAWNNPKGVQTHVEFSIFEGVSGFEEDDDQVEEPLGFLDLQLLGPNVIGQLKYQDLLETKSMSYGGISASLRCSDNCPVNHEDRWAWTSADRAGSYRLLLPTDGTWDVWVYSNSTQNPKPPIHMLAEIVDGELETWSYASTVMSNFDPSPGEVNFDALPSNLTVTITGTSEIRIIKFKDSNGNYINELTTFTSGGTPNTVNTRVPDGSYTLEVLRSSREGSAGSKSISIVGGSNSELVNLP